MKNIFAVLICLTLFSFKPNDNRRIGFQKAYLGMSLNDFKKAFPNNRKYKDESLTGYFDLSLGRCDLYRASSINISKNNFNIKVFVFSGRVIEMKVEFNDYIFYDELIRQIENKYKISMVSLTKPGKNSAIYKNYWEDNNNSIATFQDTHWMNTNKTYTTITYRDKNLYAGIRESEKVKKQNLLE